MLIDFGESRREAGWAPAGKNRDLCAVPAMQPAVPGVTAVGCQNLPARHGRGLRALRGKRCPGWGCGARQGGREANAGELRACSSQQVNKQIPALAGNRLLFNKELLKSCLSPQGEPALRHGTARVARCSSYRGEHKATQAGRKLFYTYQQH